MHKPNLKLRHIAAVTSLCFVANVLMGCTLKIYMDKILRELIENACEDAHLRRTANHRDQAAFLAETLAMLEVKGDAMRHLDAKGRIAWKVTPQLREYLRDLRMDARADEEHEAV